MTTWFSSKFTSFFSRTTTTLMVRWFLSYPGSAGAADNEGQPFLLHLQQYIAITRFQVVHVLILGPTWLYMTNGCGLARPGKRTFSCYAATRHTELDSSRTWKFFLILFSGWKEISDLIDTTFLPQLNWSKVTKQTTNLTEIVQLAPKLRLHFLLLCYVMLHFVYVSNCSYFMDWNCWLECALRGLSPISLYKRMIVWSVIEHDRCS